mmetsp:Transcript_38994/g.84843  ORF Transcript_38994/g.84843 Transcript_38994/m.84843 type:complete len:307 (-) Transcript_38994:263-1183(-)|eukprot:CAMPEP_0118944066 /NCGR_PEP_ID=MMETSP1169-20130426/39591_1 /TAXON_ID=36882 /ORGANISM="Pyramimonas obovata, Strain CCMP722" /LENGTH=306 /DNA_ID=CAMNT_0006889479 /DNA_START=611 /DNA_END=1531 /DNA_ORIENTATION=+
MEHPGDHHQASMVAKHEVIGEAGVSIISAQEALERCEDHRQVVMFFMGDNVKAKEGIVARLNNAEGIIAAIAPKFRNASVLVVQPDLYHEDCFACYANFLPSMTRSGEPLGFNPSSLRALRHLRSILQQTGCAAASEKVAVTLLGFSKGGVVLNQLLSEMAHVQDLSAAAGGGSSAAPARASSAQSDGGQDEELLALARAVQAVLYLDVGANGRGAYPTDPRVAQSLAALAPTNACGPPLRVGLHGTPRQWEDARRPWIRDEKNRCLKFMQEAGVSVAQKMYFDGVEPSMEMHFEIIDVFEASLSS